MPVSVNLSGQMAADRLLPDQLSAMLAERGLDPSALVLEITETAAIRDRDGALDVLARLRTAGMWRFIKTVKHSLRPARVPSINALSWSVANDVIAIRLCSC